MSEPTRYPTVADTHDALQMIIDAAKEAREYTPLYADVHADEINDELVIALEHIAGVARGAARRQQALHDRAAGLADAVFADIAALPEVDDTPGEELTFGEATSDAADRQGYRWLAKDPQTDREDRTADDHDRTLDDWRRAVEEGEDQ